MLHGSSPTTKVLCPGGTISTSPCTLSITAPSSIIVLTLPERISEVSGTWQVSVFSRGLTYFSLLHPGSSVTLAILKPPRFTSQGEREAREGWGINPAIKRHLELEIKALQNAK